MDSFDFSAILRCDTVDKPIRKSAILQTGRNQLAFRHNDWKIVSTEQTTWQGMRAEVAVDALEPYNLANDPFEENNLASEKPKKVAALKKRLLKQIAAGTSK